MPPKITSKNLHYDTTLPPFLQKLQGNYDRGVSDRDGRHEPALSRPRAKRARNEDDEDGPVYVDEEGNVIDAKLLNGTKRDDAEEEMRKTRPEEILSPLVGKQESEGAQSKEREAIIGGVKKRKVGRCVGSPSPAADQTADSQPKSQNDKDERSAKQEQASKPELSKDPKSSSKQKPPTNPTSQPALKKKKRLDGSKKVKLSFGDDE